MRMCNQLLTLQRQTAMQPLIGSPRLFGVHKDYFLCVLQPYDHRSRLVADSYRVSFLSYSVTSLRKAPYPSNLEGKWPRMPNGPKQLPYYWAAIPELYHSRWWGPLNDSSSSEGRCNRTGVNNITSLRYLQSPVLMPDNILMTSPLSLNHRYPI